MPGPDDDEEDRWDNPLDPDSYERITQERYADLYWPGDDD